MTNNKMKTKKWQEANDIEIGKQLDEIWEEENKEINKRR